MAAIPLHEKELRVAVEKMFLGFPVHDRTRAEKVSVYVEALARIPLKHVKEACTYAVRGRIGDGKWLPTAAEMVKLAEDFQSREFKKPVQRPDPTVHNSPEQRLRIIHGFRELIRDLKSGNPIEPDLATAKVFRIREEE